MNAVELRSRFRELRGAVCGDTAVALPLWLSSSERQIDLPSAAYALSRRQFAADVILHHLPDAGRGTALICATAADLFLERRAFVFGASMPARGVAIASAFRLENNSERLEKVALHELGHLAGLADCDGICLMTPASTCGDIDRRPAGLCSRCAEHLSSLPMIAPHPV